MLAHSSHLLQHLYVACFATLKHSYRHLVEMSSWNGYYHDKFDFKPAAFPKARVEAFKSETIKNGFVASGIMLYNPERVLEKLNI